MTTSSSAARPTHLPIPAMPSPIATDRCVLRPWRVDDVPQLGLVLAENWDHVREWVPAAAVAPLDDAELEERLVLFRAAFDVGVEWRYGIFDRAGVIQGEVSAFPRNGVGRTPYASATSAEIGFWLRRSATGRGLASEAASALLHALARLPRIAYFEIRCHPDNVRSAALAWRLGFSIAASSPTTIVWRKPNRPDRPGYALVR